MVEREASAPLHTPPPLPNPPLPCGHEQAEERLARVAAREREAARIAASEATARALAEATPPHPGRAHTRKGHLPPSPSRRGAKAEVEEQAARRLEQVEREWRNPP